MRLSVTFLLLLAMLVLESCASFGAPQSGTTTFADILKRVTVRDSATGAIIEVSSRPKAGAGTPHAQIKIEHTTSPRTVVITITVNSKKWTKPELYQLPESSATDSEMAKLAAYRADMPRRAAFATAQVARDIVEVTGGRVRYGWPEGRVIRALGKPIRIDTWQMAGGETVVYSRFTLGFDGGRLVGAYAIPPGEVMHF